MENKLLIEMLEWIILKVSDKLKFNNDSAGIIGRLQDSLIEIKKALK